MEDLKNKLTVRRILGFTLAMVIFGVVVLFQLIIADFSIDVFKQPDFYIRIVYRVVLIELVYISVVNLLYDKCLRTKKVQDAKKKYIAAVKMKDNNFDEFLKEYNHNLKKQAWIAKINKQINKISRAIEEGESIKKNTQKIKQLEELKKDEYIEKNWDYLNVKWKKLYTGEFTVEDSIPNHERRASSEFNKDVSKIAAKQIFKYVLISLCLGMVGVNIALDGIHTVTFWFNMSMDIILVLVRALDAGIQTPELIDYNFTNVYNYKTEVMQKYINWCSEHKLTESPAHKVLNYIQDVEVENKKNN